MVTTTTTTTAAAAAAATESLAASCSDRHDMDKITSEFEGNLSSLALLTRLSELEKAERARLVKLKANRGFNHHRPYEVDSQQLRHAHTISCVNDFYDLDAFLVVNVEQRRLRRRRSRAAVRHVAVKLSDDGNEDGWFSDPSSISSFDYIRQKCVRRFDWMSDEDFDSFDNFGTANFGNRSNGFVFNVDLSSGLFCNELMDENDDDIIKPNGKQRTDLKMAVETSESIQESTCLTETATRKEVNDNEVDLSQFSMEWLKCDADLIKSDLDVKYHSDRSTSEDRTNEDKTIPQIIHPIRSQYNQTWTSADQPQLSHLDSSHYILQTVPLIPSSYLPECSSSPYSSYCKYNSPDKLMEAKTDGCVSIVGDSYPCDCTYFPMNHDCSRLHSPQRQCRYSTCGGLISQPIKCNAISHYCGQLNVEVNCCGSHDGQTLNKDDGSYEEELCLLRKIASLESDKLSKIYKIEQIIHHLREKETELGILTMPCNLSPKISMEGFNQRRTFNCESDFRNNRSCEGVNSLSLSPNCTPKTCNVEENRMNGDLSMYQPKNVFGSLSLTLSKSNHELLIGNHNRGFHQESNWCIPCHQSNQSITSVINCSNNGVHLGCLKLLNHEVELTKASIQRLELQIVQLQEHLSTINSSKDSCNMDVFYKKARLLDDTRRRFEDLEFSLAELQARYENDGNCISQKRCYESCENDLYRTVAPSSLRHVQQLDCGSILNRRGTGNSDEIYALPPCQFSQKQEMLSSERDRLINELSHEHAELISVNRKIKNLHEQYSTEQLCPNERSLNYEVTGESCPAKGYYKLGSFDATYKKNKIAYPTATIGTSNLCEHNSNCLRQLLSSKSLVNCCPLVASSSGGSSAPCQHDRIEQNIPLTIGMGTCNVSSDYTGCNLIRPMPVDLFRRKGSRTRSVALSASTQKLTASSTEQQQSSSKHLYSHNSLAKISQSSPVNLETNDVNSKFTYENMLIQCLLSNSNHSSCNSAHQTTCEGFNPAPVNSGTAFAPAVISSDSVVTIPSLTASAAHSGSEAATTTQSHAFATAIMNHSRKAHVNDGRYWCSCSSSSISSSPPSSSSSINAHRMAVTKSAAAFNSICSDIPDHYLHYQKDNSPVINNHGLLNTVHFRRNKGKKQDRPLTRYLPIAANAGDFDLRTHIENAGHFIERSGGDFQCLDIDETTCRGYLMKMGRKFRTWHKRWFVFDRNQRTLFYYAHKYAEHKQQPKGLIPFKSICEVYVDHLNAVRSPYSRSTFVIKTTTRPYYLAAITLEAMRIWVDVMITGAEGHFEYSEKYGMRC